MIRIFGRASLRVNTGFDVIDRNGMIPELPYLWPTTESDYSTGCGCNELLISAKLPLLCYNLERTSKFLEFDICTASTKSGMQFLATLNWQCNRWVLNV